MKNSFVPGIMQACPLLNSHTQHQALSMCISNRPTTAIGWRENKPGDQVAFTRGQAVYASQAALQEPIWRPQLTSLRVE